MRYVGGSISCDRVIDVVRLLEPAVHPFEVELVVVSGPTHLFVNESFAGVLGLAFQPIAQPRESPVRPVIDSWLFSHTSSSSAQGFQLKLCENSTGELTIGLGSRPFEGPFFYADVVTPAYYAVTVTSILVGSYLLPFSCDIYNSPAAAIIDSGTTDLIVPELVFNAIVENLRDKLAQQPSFFQVGTCFDDSTASPSTFPDLTIALLRAGTKREELRLTFSSSHYIIHNGTCRIFAIRSFSFETLCDSLPKITTKVLTVPVVKMLSVW
eukprot:m.182148 g.182148  ORF g.182148 m.182148 type:complete len:268 (-) comp53480_c0_seq28:436-1239(-)